MDWARFAFIVQGIQREHATVACDIKATEDQRDEAVIRINELQRLLTHKTLRSELGGPQVPQPNQEDPNVTENESDKYTPDGGY